jgi:hypothetical protein
MSLQEIDSGDPQVHVAHIKEAMDELIQHLRRDVERVKEPKAQALFETSAEVIQGLVTAFDHYGAGQEAGFRR